VSFAYYSPVDTGWSAFNRIACVTPPKTASPVSERFRRR
jgi:hypothetical protein